MEIKVGIPFVMDGKNNLNDVSVLIGPAGGPLSLFFTSVGFILFLWLLIMLRRIIIRPVLQIGRVVNTAATGNLDIHVDLSRSDELVQSLIERFREFSSVQWDDASGGKSPILTVFEDRVAKMVDQMAGDLGKKVHFSLSDCPDPVYAGFQLQGRSLW
jgi:hypothetical protein